MLLCFHINFKFCAFKFKIYMKAQKRARFHVFSPFSASFYPHYIIMVKSLLQYVGYSAEPEPRFHLVPPFTPITS